MHTKAWHPRSRGSLDTRDTLCTTEEPVSAQQLLQPLFIRGRGCRRGGLLPHGSREDAVIHSAQVIARLPHPISQRALFSSSSRTPLLSPCPQPPSGPAPASPWDCAWSLSTDSLRGQPPSPLPSNQAAAATSGLWKHQSWHSTLF